MSSTSTREIKLYTVEAPERARNLKEETKLEKKKSNQSLTERGNAFLRPQEKKSQKRTVNKKWKNRRQTEREREREREREIINGALYTKKTRK
jgi:hypothetical protein